MNSIDHTSWRNARSVLYFRTALAYGWTQGSRRWIRLTKNRTILKLKTPFKRKFYEWAANVGDVSLGRGLLVQLGQKTFTDNCPHLPQFGPIIGAIRSTGAGTELIQRFEAFPKAVQVNLVSFPIVGKGHYLADFISCWFQSINCILTYAKKCLEIVFIRGILTKKCYLVWRMTLSGGLD